jgi:hypothetical protein
MTYLAEWMSSSNGSPQHGGQATVLVAETFFVDDLEDVTRDSVVVALPVGRRLLVAACMLGEAALSAADVAAMNDEQVRAWAVGELQLVGASLARLEADSAEFRAGYPRYPACAEFLRTVNPRICSAFGFATSSPAMGAVSA